MARRCKSHAVRRAKLLTENAVQVRTFARHVPEAISWENQYVAPQIIDEPVIRDGHGRSLILFA